MNIYKYKYLPTFGIIFFVTEFTDFCHGISKKKETHSNFVFSIPVKRPRPPVVTPRCVRSNLSDATAPRPNRQPGGVVKQTAVTRRSETKRPLSTQEMAGFLVRMCFSPFQKGEYVSGSNVSFEGCIKWGLITPT